MANKKNKSTTTSSVTSYIKTSQPNIIAQEYTPKTFNETFSADPYVSEYKDRADQARENVINFQYDPLKDASYQSLAKVYGQRGNLAAKNSLGDAAALNGGYGSSFAVSAAQQARNQYNQELASMVPQLAQAAYGRATDAYNMLNQAEQNEYGRYRDSIGDQWNQFLQRYNQFRDSVGDDQWAYTTKLNEAQNAWQNYLASREFNLGLKQYNDAQAEKKKGSSGGGGGGRSGGRYTGGYIGLPNNEDNGLNLDDLITEVEEEEKDKKKKKPADAHYGGGTHSLKPTNMTNIKKTK